MIAVDGPAASGKGTLARRLAAHYGLPYLDTGLLYRMVARTMLDAGQPLDDAQAAAASAGRRSGASRIGRLTSAAASASAMSAHHIHV